MAGRGRIVGSNMGSTSYENGDGPSTAQVQRVQYVCADQHLTQVPFSSEVTDVPAVWDCGNCGQEAVADGLDPQAAAQALSAAAHTARHGKPVPKTPWQHVLERRSIQELEVILDERLALLRGTLRASA
jgi:hypothetical protein